MTRIQHGPGPTTTNPKEATNMATDYIPFTIEGTTIGSITRNEPTTLSFAAGPGNLMLAFTPERDVVFYRADGRESYRCPFDTLVEALRATVGS